MGDGMSIADAWVQQIKDEAQDLNGVFALPGGEAYAVGNKGTIYHHASATSAWVAESHQSQAATQVASASHNA